MSPATVASSSLTSTTISSSAAAASGDPNSNPNPNNSSPTTSWWESIARARSRIEHLAAAVPSFDPSPLLDSDRPAHSLLSSAAAYAAVSSAVSSPSAGSGSDLLCQWLYESLQSSDSDLKLPAISYLPLIAGIYLSKIISNSSSSSSAPSLAGFEAVLLAVYSSEARSRGGRPLLVSIPDLSQPSLYHSPIKQSPSNSSLNAPSVGVISPPLEPQTAVKSTKRACIVGVALDRYYKDISVMPPQSKIDFCEFAAAWAGQDCPCRFEFDHCKDSSEKSDFGDDGEIDVAESVGRMSIGNHSNNGHCGSEGGTMEEGRRRTGERVPLPWELMQPMLRILGHCLLGPLNQQEVKDAASEAVRCLYARAVHDLMPQGILAARSLIQLDRSSKMAAKAAVLASMSNAGTVSNPDTPSKSKKPEVLLASK